VLTFNSTVDGVDIDLASGTDSITLATGANSLGVHSVESISSSDFSTASPSDDTLTLLNEVTGLTVNLQNGTNTFNLAAGTNVLAGLFNVQTVHGSESADTLTILNNVGAGTTIDLGGGGEDILNFSRSAASGVTAVNVETIHGGEGDDSIVIVNAPTGATAINGGLGADNITASAGHDSITSTALPTLPRAGWIRSPTSMPTMISLYSPAWESPRP